MNTQQVVNSILTGVDNVGYQLEAMGITDQVNRHNSIAFLMAQKQLIDGEIDSIKARIDTRKYQVEKTVKQVEALVEQGVHLALTPARFAIGTARNLLKLN